ncbi:uncharacterized protein LOC110661343 [Hevea brasiliensis]|uniref:uncharacterized protein LOC110661343 n=1 Tax=Hevea brasiliensis TaxID=3981 RepID=UPI0025E57105|nr:uncharacterized protein LOC110661343 [Hevea brasiliensis]
MSSTESFSPACEPRKFKFEELAIATRHFSNIQLVGIGDFGDVYVGYLPGVEVNIAIKKLKYKQDEKQEEEFKNQIKDFGIVSHPNLVKLLGYCCEEADRLLVLEFVPNKSLRFHLSDEYRRSNLNWSKRMKIAVGSARGLAHLHDECYPKIIHGDIKSDNILLDNDFTPKIADFGLANLFPNTNSLTHISSCWKRTNVYADPEDYYHQKDENILQKISEKSDVYSFGVVLLELITGRKIFDEHRVDIVNWAKPFMFKGDSVEINYSCLVDSALKGDYIKSEMELMIYCAAVSVYRPPEFRPRMKQIVEALEGKMPSNELWVAEVNAGKASESRSSKAGDMSETTSSPFQELKEITEASNLHWSKATRLCKLFWENVGESIYSSNLQPLAQKVVDLCCYHSHAIFLMSKALKDESDVDVWNNAIETLNMQAASPEQELEHIMVNVLKFSYLRLPDDTTRRCLKNGALFFENEKIARKSLIDNWISDDLTDTYQKGRNVLETLVTAGLLERSEDGQFFTLHEIDRCILLEHVFPSIEGLFLMRNDSKLTELPKDVDWKEFHEIYLMDNKLTELSENLSCPKAQALFLQRNLKLRTISDSFFHGMLALQILNLSGTPIKYLPDPLFDLVKLKRFSLNHCVLLKLLPSRIGNLSCLEVFHLEGTQIIALPKEVERLKNLTSLKVSFREPLSFNQQTNMIPDGFIPNLTELKNLCIDVSPEDNRWKASVRRVVLDVSTLKTLDTLQFYFPNVELLSHFNWNTIPTSPPLSHFKFTVGDHTNRIIRRLPHDAEIELGRYDKCLKHVNGKGAPEEIKKVLRHASAFFLDRNTTVEKFSEFEITNMTQLKCCVAGECDKLQAIINGDQMVSNASGEREVGLQSLEYLYIYYARSLRSIWEGRLDNSSLKALKFLTLYMCPQLTTIFTPGLLANLSCLEELTVKDCSQVTRLVSGIDSENEIKHINLPLKKISLHFLPQLDRISDVLSIAQEMEWMSFYYCPNLKSLPISKASHTKLRKIKGEESWWKDILEWENTERDSWEGIFTPCGESEEFSPSFKRSDALLEATASPLLEETTSKSKSLTEGNPSETMILSQFRGKGAEISQSLNESDALEATASSLFEEMTSESKSLIRGDSSETMIPAQFGETTSESKSLTEEDPSKTMIPALFRGKSAEFSPPLMESDAQEATASSLFEGNHGRTLPRMFFIGHNCKKNRPDLSPPKS